MLNWAIRFHQGNAVQNSTENLSHPSQDGYHQEKKNKTTIVTTNIGNYGGHTEPLSSVGGDVN